MTFDGEERMVASTLRLVAGVVAMAVVGAAAGYGAGLYAQRDIPESVGQAMPVRPASTTPTLPKKTPVPVKVDPLDPDQIVYRTRTFEANWEVMSSVTLQVPGSWRLTRPQDDEARYTDRTGHRFIRIEAGYRPALTVEEAMKVRDLELRSQEASDELKVLSKDVTTMTNRDDEELSVATLVYTYIPDNIKRLVIVRWIGFGKDSLSAIEISLRMLPQDKDSYQPILARATETVSRRDA